MVAGSELWLGGIADAFQALVIVNAVSVVSGVSNAHEDMGAGGMLTLLMDCCRVQVQSCRFQES